MATPYGELKYTAPAAVPTPSRKPLLPTVPASSAALQPMGEALGVGLGEALGVRLALGLEPGLGIPSSLPLPALAPLPRPLLPPRAPH